MLGPSYATAKLLQKTGMSIADIGVWEFHEAFAGQVLANINAMNSDAWCKKNLKLDTKLGELPMVRALTSILLALTLSVVWCLVSGPDVAGLVSSGDAQHPRWIALRRVQILPCAPHRAPIVRCNVGN